MRETDDLFVLVDSKKHRHPAIPKWGRIGLVVLASAVGLTIFDRAATPAVAISIGWMSFAWERLITARWLWSTDLDRVRGRVVALAYAGSTLWRFVGLTFLISISLAILLNLFDDALRRRGVSLPQSSVQVLATFWIMVAGSLAASAVSSVAIAMALLFNVPIWIGPEAKIARSANQWPPKSTPGRMTSPPANGWVSLKVWNLFGVVIQVFVAIMLLGVAGATKMWSNVSGYKIALLFMTILVLIADFIFLLVDSVALDYSPTWTTTATSPEDCWPSMYFSEINESVTIDSLAWPDA